MVEQVPGSSRDCLGGSDILGEWWMLGGVRARLCLGCAFWQVKLQECVNDIYDV